MNTQFEELIARHLNGTLREDEKQLLAMMLKVPENQLYLASKIDEKFLDENLSLEAEDGIGTVMFQRIRERIRPGIKGRDNQGQGNKVPEVTEKSDGPEVAEAEVVPMTWYRRSAFRWMAAASVILIVALVVLWNNNRSNEQPVVVQNKEHADSVLFTVHREVNTTGREKNIQLPDGSLVALSDKSEITYQLPFTNQRAITLTGKAGFKVAKDQARPFTVISGDIATTALGTEFTVTAFAQAKQITVRLYEGNVVVKPVVKENWRMKGDVYLSPGQEFVYSDKALAYVRPFRNNNASTEKPGNKEMYRDDPSIPENRDGSWYMFNNQSLGQVLDQLSGLYNVKIVYNKKDVQNINWTGQYNKSDSLETILSRIGIVHNLRVTRKDTAFIISR